MSITHTGECIAVNHRGSGQRNLLVSLFALWGLAVCGQTPPANDSFASRIQLTGDVVSATGNTEWASRETGEPNHGNVGLILGGRSIWWTWTATKNETVRVDTKGSSFDTVLAVYTGNAVNSLNSRGFNDDADPDRSSRATFQAFTGTAYHIAVDGYGVAKGDVVLHLVQGPLAPVFTNVTAELTRLPGANVTLIANAIGKSPFSYQWLKDGLPIEGANSPSLPLTGVQSEQSGTYQLGVSNSVGNALATIAVLRVTDFAIATPPVEGRVTAGYDAAFTVQTLSSSPTSYQWSRGSEIIPNATNTTLVLGAVRPEDAGIYRVNVTYGAGNSTNLEAPLTIASPSTFGTLAGTPNDRRLVDGDARSARFYYPSGIIRDRHGNLFVSEYYSQVIRKIAPDGSVSTFAGLADTRGTNDGVGMLARFSSPEGLAIDGADNVYVADNFNYTIRKITPAGEVSTFAGLPGTYGAIDGTGSEARFLQPSALAFDKAGYLFVTEWGNNRLRKISPGGVVTTFAGTGTKTVVSRPVGIAVDIDGNCYVTQESGGILWIGSNGLVLKSFGVSGVGYGGTLDSNGNYLFMNNGTLKRLDPEGRMTTMAGEPGEWPHADGSGRQARFPRNRTSLTTGPGGTLYIADAGSSVIRIGVPFTVAAPASDQAVNLGTDVNLSVDPVDGGPFFYQWFRDGAVLVGQTAASLSITSMDRSKSGRYSVKVSDALGQNVTLSSVARAIYPALLQPPEPTDGSHLLFRLLDNDGGVPYYLPGLKLQRRTSLPAGTDTNWQTLTGSFVLTNGFATRADTNAWDQPTGFYRVLTR